MELFTKGKTPDKLLGLSHLMFKKVISKSGAVIGFVGEVFIDDNKLRGVKVLRFFNTLFIGADYIDKVSANSVMLSINPCVMHYKKKVRTADGKQVGIVSSVIRDGNTNDIKSIIIKRFLLFKYTVPFSEVKKIGSAVILKKDYEDAKKLFKRSSD